MKKYVADKIEDLEKETKRLKEERERLRLKERKLNDDTRSLQKEKDDYYKMMKEEKDKFELYKEEELRKIRKEKKTSEKNQKATANMPSRKEREEIEALRDKLNKQTEEFKEKEKKYKLTIDRQKKQAEELASKAKELEEQVHLYEQMRLDKTSASIKTPKEVPDKASKGQPAKKIAPSAKEEVKGAVKDRNPATKDQSKTKEATLSETALRNTLSLSKPGYHPDSEDEDLDDFQKNELAVTQKEGFGHAHESRKQPDETDLRFQETNDLDQYVYSANVYYQEYAQGRAASTPGSPRKSPRHKREDRRERQDPAHLRRRVSRVEIPRRQAARNFRERVHHRLVSARRH